MRDHDVKCVCVRVCVCVRERERRRERQRDRAIVVKKTEKRTRNTDWNNVREIGTN